MVWGFFEIEGGRRDRAHWDGFAIGRIGGIGGIEGIEASEGSLCREEVGREGRGSGRSRGCDSKAWLEKRLGTA